MMITHQAHHAIAVFVCVSIHHCQTAGSRCCLAAIIAQLVTPNYYLIRQINACCLFCCSSSCLMLLLDVVVNKRSGVYNNSVAIDIATANCSNCWRLLIVGVPVRPHSVRPHLVRPQQTTTTAPAVTSEIRHTNTASRQLD